MAFSYNLRIATVMFIGGPSPTLVCAVTWNIYTFSDDNPPTVYISTSQLVLVTIRVVELYLSEYSTITPLGVRGGLHFNITELELTPIISNDSGALGPANKIWFYFAEMFRFLADNVKYVTKSGKTGPICTFCISRNTYLKHSMRCPSLVVQYNHARCIMLIVYLYS